MPSKQRGIKIKKSRIMLILKSRKITVTKMSEDIGYNRGSISFAINREYMDSKTLDDICRYLDVSPKFFTGEHPLRKLKPEYLEGIPYDGEIFTVDHSDPSGYDVPKYSDYTAYKDFLEIVRHENNPYYDLFCRLGKQGISWQPFNNKVLVHFDSDFVHDNSEYLFTPVKEVVRKTLKSAIDQDAEYLRWKEQKEANDYFEAEKIEALPDIYDVIEPGIPLDQSDDLSPDPEDSGQKGGE